MTKVFIWCIWHAASILLLVMLAGCNAPAAAPQSPQEAQQTSNESFGFGREVSEDEIAAWDIDIMPDGTGLPGGGGSVMEGKAIYELKCMACHGVEGVGGPNDQLVGRLPGDAFAMDTDLSQRRLKAVGSYWPYSTTLFDYIRRAMPQPMPGSLGDAEVYALTAYILYLNDLVAEDAVMNATSLPKVLMPARDLYVPDDRLDHEQVH